MRIHTFSLLSSDRILVVWMCDIVYNLMKFRVYLLCHNSPIWFSGICGGTPLRTPEFRFLRGIFWTLRTVALAAFKIDSRASTITSASPNIVVARTTTTGAEVSASKTKLL